MYRYESRSLISHKNDLKEFYFSLIKSVVYYSLSCFAMKFFFMNIESSTGKHSSSSNLLISILPTNHAGPVEKLTSDFFRMPEKVGAIDSL